MNKFIWLFRMAWRDARTQWSRFALFMSSISIGLAALFSISIFNDSIQNAIEQQAKTLLGADLVISSRQPFTDESLAFEDSLSLVPSVDTRFSSMVLASNTGRTRLAEIHGFEGRFPYYGELNISGGQRLSDLRTGQAFVDAGLAELLGVAPNDSLKIGQQFFHVHGLIRKIPGESATEAFIGPRIYIPLSDLETTGLLQRGSRITYSRSYRFGEGMPNPDSLVANYKSLFQTQRVRTETVESRKQTLGRALSNMYRFLNLVGFVALILGALGVGSSMNVYARQKRETVALLRCIGVQSGEATGIFIIQSFFLALLGSGAGLALCLLFIPLFPLVFGTFLPVDFHLVWNPITLLSGFGFGLLFSLLLSMLPLVSVRRVSPLLTLRAGTETESPWRDPLFLILSALIGLAVFGFASFQTNTLQQTLGFFGGLVVAFSVLSVLAWSLMWAARRWLPASWPYAWRQGIANLFRPNNQTLLIAVSIGLGTFLIMTLFLAQTQLIQELRLSRDRAQPNLILFDIQYDQKDQARALVQRFDLPILGDEAIVTMRLAKIGNRTVEEILSDSTRTGERWALGREYRSTYRDSLTESEKLIKGEFISESSLSAQVVPVTLGSDIAKDLAVGVGDTLVWDVQGIPITTYVSGLREIDWQSGGTNFFVVFPKGVLEGAPQFRVLLTKYESDSVSIALRRQLVEELPNISVIDVNQLLDTVESILDKVALAIQFMAFFSVLTGIVVLIVSLISSRLQRIRESVLLRTMGGSSAQIQQIQRVEFLAIGIISALTGIILSVAATYILVVFSFEIGFVLNPFPLVLGLLLIVGLTVGIGWLNTRGLLKRPPLEVLRESL